MASIPNPADIRYGGFYLPVFSLLYINREIGFPVDLPVPVLSRVFSASNFPLLLGLTFLGAIITHGESRSIYGIEGAEGSPKDSGVVRWYRILFTFKKKPGRPPKTLDDLFRKLEYSTSWFANQSLAGKFAIVLYRISRFVVTWPSKVTLVVTALLTTAILAGSAVQAGLQLIGGVLLLGQLVFFFGSAIFNRFPTVVPTESAPWIYLAEYEKADYLYERGDIEFEYDPRGFTDSAYEILEEIGVLEGDQRNIYNTPPKYDNENTDWLVPIEKPDPDYLIDLDDSSTEKSREE